jgi:hypothetical protein
VTRWLRLYLLSRRVPLASAVSIGAVALIWVAWLAFSNRREVSESLTVLTVVLALAPMIPTLAGDDDALESTAALPWPPRRALHLIACFAVVAAALAATRGTGAWFGPTWQVVRDCAGLTGLIGLGVALVGTRLAWQLPISWTALQVVLGGPESDWRQALYWLVQPADNRVAAVTAALLFLAGVAAYAWRAGPRVSAVEVTMGQ